MSIIIGIDVGGSTTKIVGLTPAGELISTMMVKAYDQRTSLYGALGSYVDKNGISLSDVAKIYITGVGASCLSRDIYGIRTYHIQEFSSIGQGGLHLADLDEAIVISMGTGTAFVNANKEHSIHLGGSGVGGGTLLGLGCKLTSADDFDSLCKLADKGDLSRVDLTIGAITTENIPTLHPEITAANFANISGETSEADIALGLVNMVLQTVFTLGVFASRSVGRHGGTIILTGSLAPIKQVDATIESFSLLYPNKFIIPPYAAFATAIGAALHGID